MQIGPIREPIAGLNTGRVERVQDIQPIAGRVSGSTAEAGDTQATMNRQERLSEQEVKKVVDGMNVILERGGSHLKYAYHDQLGEYYVEIIDDRTNEVIKEIPPKRWLDLVATMWEQLGWIIDKKL